MHNLLREVIKIGTSTVNPTYDYNEEIYEELKYEEDKEDLEFPWLNDDEIPTLVIDEDEVDFTETFNEGNYDVFKYYSDLLDDTGIEYSDEIFDVPMETILFWEPINSSQIEISVDLDTLKNQLKQFS